MFRTIVLVALMATLPPCVHAETPTVNTESDHAIHEELRSVLQTIESAINTGDYDKMLPVLSEQIRATPIDQEFLASRPEVSAYFKRWFGAGGYLKKLDIHFTPSARTELSPDRNWGVVYGTGSEKYVLSDGRFYDMHTRWTATMAKEADGHWRVRAIHIGTNFLDNPILTQAEHSLLLTGGLAGAGGVLIGGFLGWFLTRKKKR
jgi:ketosteroid isomerase-like protein